MDEINKNDINLTFVRGGSAVVGVKNRVNEFWCCYDKVTEENKFYLPMDGSGEIFIDGTHYTLERGRWFLIGANETRSYYTVNTGLEKWLVHFYGQADGKNIKDALDLPDYVDLDDEEYEKALELMQRVKGTDMQSPSDLYELFENKAKVFDALAYYTKLAREKNLHRNTLRDADAQIRKVIFEYIRRNGPDNLNIKALSDAIGMNERYFLKYFKKLFFTTPNELILKRRMSNVCGSLSFYNCSVAEIAEKCGFESESYFCEWFKKNMGVSPLQFRKERFMRMGVKIKNIKKV